GKINGAARSLLHQQYLQERQQVKPDHHRDKNRHGAPHATTTARGVLVCHRLRHVHRFPRPNQACTSPCASSSSWITGGTAKVWCGAGEGTVHSKPLAPSHTRSAAFFFEKNAQWISTPRKISCEAPNRKPPIELIMLKLANATL